MKGNMQDLKDIIAIVIYTFALMLIGAIMGIAAVYNGADAARCKSLGGEFGGNKCFVRGEEK